MLNPKDNIPIDLSDTKQFKAEYEQHFSALKYFAGKYINDEALICDLIQDLFVKLWEKREVFENELVFRTYLYRSVRNNCLTYLRNLKRREIHLQDYEPEETEDAFINEIIEAEIYAFINEIFEKLPPTCRQVYLKSLEGKSHKEIAEELHIAINTIKRHKNNANRYLRRHLEKLLCFIAFF